MCRACRSGGFTLVEVIVAMAIMVAVAVGVAQLFAIATTAVRVSRDRTIAITLAIGKLEQLRSLTWRIEVNAAGMVTLLTDLDSNLSVEPPASGGPGLSESPAGTLDGNVPPYVDYFGRLGERVGAGATPPSGAVYIRRWAIRRAPSDPAQVLALQVLVTTVFRERTRVPAIPQRWNGDDVLLATLIARKAR